MTIASTVRWSPQEATLCRDSFNAIFSRTRFNPTEAVVWASCMSRAAQLGPKWLPSGIARSSSFQQSTKSDIQHDTSELPDFSALARPQPVDEFAEARRPNIPSASHTLSQAMTPEIVNGLPGLGRGFNRKDEQAAAHPPQTRGRPSAMPLMAPPLSKVPQGAPFPVVRVPGTRGSCATGAVQTTRLHQPGASIPSVPSTARPPAISRPISHCAAPFGSCHGNLLQDCGSQEHRGDWASTVGGATADLTQLHRHSNISPPPETNSIACAASCSVDSRNQVPPSVKLPTHHYASFPIGSPGSESGRESSFSSTQHGTSVVGRQGKAEQRLKSWLHDPQGESKTPRGKLPPEAIAFPPDFDEPRRHGPSARMKRYSKLYGSSGSKSPMPPAS